MHSLFLIFDCRPNLDPVARSRQTLVQETLTTFIHFLKQISQISCPCKSQSLLSLINIALTAESVIIDGIDCGRY